MAYRLTLPARLNAEGYIVKIRDKERVEPPHVTIFRKELKWRFGLRGLEFLDEEPDPGLINEAVIEEIKDKICSLRKKWDEMYGQENPVNMPCPKEDCDVCSN